MTKQNMILNMLMEYSCSTSEQISFLVRRAYDEKISKQSISGILRPYVARGIVGKSPNGAGKTVYWVTKYGEEIIKKGELV